ncbi:MAG: BACON domain-containing protein [Bacteroidales bacterium]|nr:BACON domain-containing protein [Bacteroidales bacterium]
MLFTLLFLIGGMAMVSAQTAGEKNSFETMKNAANVYMLNGDFAAAKAQYEGILKLYRQYDSFIKEIRPDYEKCLKELDKAAAVKKESERLVFSEPFVNFAYTEEAHSVTVTAGKGGLGKWEVVSCPEWCTLDRGGNNLVIKALRNPDPTLRNSEIIIKMTSGGKTVTRGLPVLQIARPLQERSVRILTNPEGAQITVGNDPTPRISPVTLTLSEGETPIHILRNDYFPMDTFVSVSATDDPKMTKEYKFDLVPRFALAKLTLKAGSGNLDDKNPKLFIGGRAINLDGYYGRGGLKTFNSAGTMINHFELYQDSERNIVIPLEPATYQVIATANDFEDYSYSFTVREGEMIPLDIVMTPKSGTIRFFSGKNAEGTVIKDGSTPIGTIVDKLELPFTADDHKISFEKPDYMSEIPTYAVHVNPGETIDFEINMVPLSYLTINTDPVGVEVVINDVAEGIRTPVYSKPVTLGENTILLRQKNYYPVKLVNTSRILGERDTISVSLKPTHPLKVLSDSFQAPGNPNAGFNIYISSLDGGEDFVINEYDHFTDAVLDLPYGRYKYEYRRYSLGHDPGFNQGIRLRGEKRRRDLAYKGTFRFSEKKDVLNRMSYSANGNFALLTGNLLLMDHQVTANELPFKEVGNLEFLKMYVWPGFSTAFAKGVFFNAVDEGTTPKNLFSASCVFLNGEQRIGGGLHQFLDVDLLASYYWLPVLHTIEKIDMSWMTFNYVNMRDLFFGLEFHSRFPVLNANFKIGYRSLKGGVNLYNKNGKNSGYDVSPFEFGGIMASIGFTLGGKESKGANILRVFYL